MSRAERADRSFRRTIGIFALLLASSYLVFSGIYSHAAPLGSWENQIFGEPAWRDWDPGGPYVDSAHQLTWGEGQLFVGHPGTVLLLILSAIQHIYYAVAGSGTGFSFTEFTARNLPTVFVLSKLVMTGLHLVACFVVFLLAKHVLRDERAAAFSALGYATSLPVGYYLSRISVEPLVVIFFGLSLLSIWRYQDLAVENRVALAFRFAALSGVLGVSGLVTKLNFLAPLIPFLALYVLLGGWGEANARSVTLRTRLIGLLIFTSTAFLSLLFYSQFIDWHDFFNLWRTIAATQSPDWNLSNLLPGFSPGRVFPMSELGFVGLGVIGVIAFLRRHADLRPRALWLSAFGLWGLVIFGYRISKSASFLPFHYFNLSNVVVAVFFGYAVLILLRRFRPGKIGSTIAAFGIGLTLLIHGVAFWTVIDSRRQDALRYAPAKEIHAMIAALKPGQRLGCIQCAPLMNPQPRRIFPRWFSLTSTGWTIKRDPDFHSRLTAEFDSLIVPFNPGTSTRPDEIIKLPGMMGTVILLDEARPFITLDAERRS